MKIVTIFGGSGFIGRYVAQRMAHDGWRVRVAVRRPNEALFVRTYGVVGQVEPIQANIRDEASTRAAIAGSEAVINCVSVPFEEFHRLQSDQVEGAARVARIANQEGASRLVHISALGADIDAPSEYAQSKAQGEAEVLAHFPGATILRPSVVFGSEDQFFNRFAEMARMSPVIPLFGAGTRFQPVFVDDVAKAAATAAQRAVPGIFELGGPDAVSFKDLITGMLQIIRRKRVVLALPNFLGRIMGAVFDFVQFASMGLLPNKMITRDQVRQLADDNVLTGQHPGFEAFGIVPRAMEGLLETYLYTHRPYGQYTRLTESAGDLH